MKNYSDYDMENYKDLVDSLYSHANQELGFKKPPTLIFQSDPSNYGALAKTAQYDPSSQEITIYVDGRHIKDILRSFAHELVHHHQNEQGRLSGANVTQGEQDFDDIEGEAYHTGNLKLFRKWEDKLKQDSPTIYNERRIYKMSTKKWKNKELSNLMTEKFGYKMDLSKLNESVQEEQIEEAKGRLVKHAHSDKVEIRKDPEGHNEWTVKKKGASGTGYHTDDLADAKLTAKKMAGEEMNEEELDENGCGKNEEMDEGKEEKCEKCEKAKSDCECPKEAMDEEKEDNVKMVKPDEVDGREIVVPDGPGPLVGVKAEYKIQEHKIWNDKGFKMDLNKLLK